MSRVLGCAETSFFLYHDKIVVSGQVFGGRDFETHIPLKGLVADYGYVRCRSRLCVGGFAIFAAFAVLLWLFVGPFGLPPASGRVIVTLFLALGSLALAVAFFPKYTAYRFVNHSGIVVLDVIESGPDQQHCGDFVEQLAGAVRRATVDPAR